MSAATLPQGRRVRAALCAAVVAALAFFAFVLVINPSAIIQTMTTVALPQLSERLGREVTLGHVHVRLFPTVRVDLRNLSIAGGPGEPPLVSIGDAEVSLRLWPLLRSRGHEIQVSGLALRNPEVNLVRRKDGRWSFLDLGARPGPAAPASPEAPGAAPPELVISRLSVEDGSVHVIDPSRAREERPPIARLELSHVDLQARDVGRGHRLSLQLKGALASDSQNVSASLTVSPRSDHGADPGEAGWPVIAGRLAIQRLELRTFQGFVPGSLAPIVSGGRISATADLSTEPSGTYALVALASVDDVTVRGAPASGGFTLRTTINPARPASLTVRVEGLRLKGPGVDIGGDAS